jgi:2-dehydropantoate 2-reductase
MNIVIFGSGAIGSLFGALLSKNNNVLLIGRKPHINFINKNGLTIEGITNLNVNIKSEFSVDKVNFSSDLLILTVKSYDTKNAILQAKKIVTDDTYVLSIQNGLDNIEKISSIIDSERIIVGTTTHGALFTKPGIIKHTGYGMTVLGKLKGNKTKQINNIINLFNEAGIKTRESKDILKDVWVKAIINSCINPLTAIFRCKNGHLAENPILEKLLDIICEESVNIAKSEGVDISYSDILSKTKEVVKNTSDNYSSMLQSINNGKKTEVDSINGKLIEIGNKNNVSTMINEILVYSVNST